MRLTRDLYFVKFQGIIFPCKGFLTGKLRRQCSILFLGSKVVFFLRTLSFALFLTTLELWNFMCLSTLFLNTLQLCKVLAQS